MKTLHYRDSNSSSPVQEDVGCYGGGLFNLSTSAAHPTTPASPPRLVCHKLWSWRNLNCNMTQILMHKDAHSTRPSFRPKTNNQPIKKFLSLLVSWVKVVKNWKTLTFKVNFLWQKWFESFYIFFIEEYHFLLLTFFENIHF